ncbi:hypothetical protein CDIK_2998 [Cucumispora dikerogammari]|nr:hypothetical protein CDIK_2998 [Cucumispora dikerogammari]
MLHYTLFIMFKLFCIGIIISVELQESLGDIFKIYEPRLVATGKAKEDEERLNQNTSKIEEMYEISFMIEVIDEGALKQYLGDFLALQLNRLQVYKCDSEEEDGVEYCDAAESVCIKSKDYIIEHMIFNKKQHAENPQFTITLKDTEEIGLFDTAILLLYTGNKGFTIFFQLTIRGINTNDPTKEKIFTLKTPAIVFSHFLNGIYYTKGIETRNLLQDTMNPNNGSQTRSSPLTAVQRKKANAVNTISDDTAIDATGTSTVTTHVSDSQSLKQKTLTKSDNHGETTEEGTFLQQTTPKNTKLTLVEEEKPFEQHKPMKRKDLKQPGLSDTVLSGNKNKEKGVYPITNIATQKNNTSTTITSVSRTGPSKPLKYKWFYICAGVALCVLLIIVILVIKRGKVEE